jgi:putative PIN family toxin of toxin-antitoxin system
VKVVIDTSVVVSAALKDKDPETILLFIVSRPDIEWIVSPAILEEYEAVLSRSKFGLPQEILERWHRIFCEVTTLIHPIHNLEFGRDQKDAIFLECAISADAEYLVTSDKDFVEAM